MLKSQYLVGLGASEGKTALQEAARSAKAAPAPGGPAGSGLDAAVAAAHAAALEEGAGSPDLEGNQRRPRDVEEISEEEPSRKRKPLEAHLRERYKEGMNLDKGRHKKKRKAEDSKKKEKKKKRKDSRSPSKGSGSSSAESSPFRVSSAWGGDLWRVSQKKPGHLAERSLNEMIRYLAERSDLGGSGNTWSGQKVLAYLNQVVMANHPPQKMGVMRSQRELQTLAMSVDEILAGRPQRALDLLLQRFKAIEASFHEGGWNTARHLELIPQSAAMMSREDERQRAAKAELEHMKLKEKLMRAQKANK
eukprot:Skav212009  [mRNA]  locus=C8996354:51:968:- [translate_table: standard]